MSEDHGSYEWREKEWQRRIAELERQLTDAKAALPIEFQATVTLLNGILTLVKSWEGRTAQLAALGAVASLALTAYGVATRMNLVFSDGLKAGMEGLRAALAPEISALVKQRQDGQQAIADCEPIAEVLNYSPAAGRVTGESLVDAVKEVVEQAQKGREDTARIEWLRWHWDYEIDEPPLRVKSPTDLRDAIDQARGLRSAISQAGEPKS